MTRVFHMFEWLTMSTGANWCILLACEITTISQVFLQDHLVGFVLKIETNQRMTKQEHV